MITIQGQLAIRTIPSKNGPFNVGRLFTSIGEFECKDAVLDQYREGKYDGDFIITKIYSKPWSYNGRIGIDTRADLGGITLSGIESLSKDEAHRLSPQEVDPIDEEVQRPSPATSTAAPPAPTTVVAETAHASDAQTDTTSVGSEEASSASPDAPKASEQDEDAALFGTIWPLGTVIKLDATVDRRMLRKQRDRLDKLGYEFDARSQNWHLLAA